MMFILGLILPVLHAEDRPVAVFPRANRMIVESRTEEFLTYRECALAADRSKPPTDCKEIGSPVPTSAEVRFRAALDAELGQVTARAHRTNVRYARAYAAILASWPLSTWAVLRFNGREVSRASFYRTIKSAAPFVAFGLAIHGVGDVLARSSYASHARALNAFARPRPDEFHDGVVILNDLWNIHAHVIRAIEAAGRAAAP